MNYLILGISFTILEIISIYIQLTLTYLIWKENLFVKTAQISSLISALILILSPICLNIGPLFISEFWLETYDLGLALIVPYFGAFFAFLTALLASKKLPK